jgi:hypothetical protein
VTDAPIRDADGTLIGIIGVAIDPSEQRQLKPDAAPDAPATHAPA